MFKTIFYLFAAGAIALVAAGCARQDAAAAELGNGAAQDGARLTVRTAEVDRGQFVHYGRYFGEVRAIAHATLQAAAGGKVETLLAGPGDSVSRGQSLARIDAERAIATWETAQLAERLAQEAYERETRFLEQGVSSQQKVDQARLEWLRSRSGRIEAEAVRDGALAISPLDGIVAARHIERFQELPPGARTFSVADMSRMKVTVGVPEADIAGVQQLGDARISFSSLPDRIWEGETTGFARRRSDHAMTFEVEIEIDNRDGLLLAGQTAQVELALRTLPDAVQIPSRAVVIRGNRASVFVVEEGSAVQRAVRLGPANTTHTVLLEGLDGGEHLVIEGMNRLTDGTAVRTVAQE